MPQASEYYEVAKTVEVVAEIGGSDQQLRIEALLDRRTGRYLTRGYILRQITVQFAYNDPNVTSDNVSTWVEYDVPWTDRGSPDDAIRQAMGFLGIEL